MPGSREDALTKVTHLMRSYFSGRRRRDPGSILDVGAGFAKYGLLFREYLDLCYVGWNRRKWVHRIDAVEVFAPYVQPWYLHIYDHVFVGEFLAMLNGKPYEQRKLGEPNSMVRGVPHYDAIYLGDVIEHWPKNQGVEVIKACAKLCRIILISTPNKFKRQSERMGNQREQHHCLWTPLDMKPLARTIGMRLASWIEGALHIIELSK